MPRSSVLRSPILKFLNSQILKLSLLFSVFTLLLFFASCSTTKRLAEGETLYTGLKGIAIERADKGAIPGSVREAVTVPLSVKPNNPLVGASVRTPLPIGLWAYNSLYTDKKTGFRAWMYRMFAKQPVLVERDVQPAARSAMVSDILDNHGYFGSTVDYRLYPRGAKRARVGYDVKMAREWRFADVRFPPQTDSLTRVIAQIAKNSKIRTGLQYNVDTLTRERERISGELRRRGYYYFLPEYLDYQADTTRARYEVDLRMNVSPTAPEAALEPYRIGNLRFRINSVDGRGEPDSTVIDGTQVWFQGRMPLRWSIIRRAITLRTGVYPGLPADVPAINRSMDNLVRLGVFRYVNLETTPMDSLRRGDSIDLTLTAAMNNPMEIVAEADIGYKTSGFLGPRLSVSMSHNNLFRGGEVLSVGLVGSYEWQTGNAADVSGGGAINSYELGVKASLAFPRLLVPSFIGLKINRRGPGKTSYTMGADLLNRPQFFRMVKFNVSNTYEFRTSNTVTHSLTIFKLAYNRLLRTTAGFDATMAANPMVALSFRDQFVPSGSYTYMYEKRYGRSRRDRVTLQVQLTGAGNLWAGGFALFGARGGEGARKLFGSPYSQFFKESAELRWYKKIYRINTLAVRLFAGAGHAYGNSSVMPYTEQFYSGGANSLRAFTVRSIGPGSYRYTGADAASRYFDQTGDLRLEMNVEYRFPITGGLHGAAFLDAGNIWLLRDDPARPGGRIGSTPFFESVATGTGVGLRYDMTFLVARIDLGIPLHFPYATSRHGYYNVPHFRRNLGLHIAIGYPF